MSKKYLALKFEFNLWTHIKYIFHHIQTYPCPMLGRETSRESTKSKLIYILVQRPKLMSLSPLGYINHSLSLYFIHVGHKPNKYTHNIQYTSNITFGVSTLPNFP